MRIVTRALVILAAVLVLAGCVPPSPQARAARESVIELVNGLGDIRGYDINAVAREIADDPGVTLLAIREQDAATRDDTLGTLTLLVPDRSGRTPRGYCFEVQFNWYGYAGVFDGDREPTPVECPQDPQALVPPPDTSIHSVVVDNAREAAIAVLTAAAPDADAGTITDEIAARLIAPTGEYERAAPPRVVVDGGDIGVAMGGADDCVLVSRVDGVVADLHPPRVLLQEGEYGCRPETALVDPAQLQPPH